MFFQKQPEAAQAREQADNLLRMAAKVEAYRADVMTARLLDSLQAAAERLRELRNDKAAKAAALDEGCEELHEVMTQCGGDIYPVTALGENVEMLLVAAIVAIGVRTFFLQPFKIPTNSMYPTYFGMTPYIYAADAPGPNAVERGWHFLTNGSIHYDVAAAADGNVVVPVDVQLGNPGAVMVASQTKMGRKWFGLLPEEQREYTFKIGGTTQSVTVPKDFPLNEVFLETLFPKDKGGETWEQMAPLNDFAQYLLRDANGQPVRDENGHYQLVSPRKFHQGERVLNFDRRTGDMLFVDRFTYNFFPPKVGDPFVFSTTGIPMLENASPPQGGQYFIKRLVGRPGDTLEVKAPALWNNGALIHGAKSFALEATRSDNYPGYVNVGSLGPGELVTVPTKFYFAMGDNSPLSYDSRYWGPVPQQNIVGRALVIVYPFTNRWGLAK
jgi:signal peptidase I